MRMGGGVVLAVAVVVAVTMSGRTSGSSWCVCKNGVNETALQKTLDYACGSGADCNPIHSNGVCFNPNTVLAHCSYAVNSFFQRKSQSPGTCDFLGVATVTASDPSYTSCAYPASASTATSTGTGTGTVPVTASTTNPYTTTNPNNGILGGMGPSGTNMDDSAAFSLTHYCSPFTVLLLLFLLLL